MKDHLKEKATEYLQKGWPYKRGSTILYNEMTRYKWCPVLNFHIQRNEQKLMPFHFRCPLLLDMDVMYFAKHFLRLELPVCALGCLLLVCESDVREKNLNAIWGQVSKQDVMKQMTLWTEQGRVIPMAKQVSLWLTYFD